MKGFTRPDPGFALCGLACALCPMHHMERSCPGCGGGEGNQSCAIAQCSLQHGGVEHCFQCPEYPCAKYEGFFDCDSFLPHRCVPENVRRAQEAGLDALRQALREREDILRDLLAGYNDGRRKTFFCTAAALLPLADLRQACEVISAQYPLTLPEKERSAGAAEVLRALAAERAVDLKLRKKPKKA